MARFIFPILLLIAAGAVFFFFTDPLVFGPKMIDAQTKNLTGGILALQTEKKILESALVDARALEERINELNAKLASISEGQIARLDAFLPDTIDATKLIVDTNAIARRSGMTISDVDVKEELIKKEENISGGPRIVPVTLSFSVSGSYNQLRSFLSDMATSLRVMDITDLSFDVEEDKPTIYEISLTTYTVK